MSDGTINKTIHIAAPREIVWEYLTRSDELVKWFHKPDGDFVSGAPFTMRGQDGSTLCNGAIEEIEPPARLTYSFTAGPMNGLMTKVAWTLTEVAGGTRLALVHSGFPANAEAFGLLVAFDKGWDGHLLRMREIESR